MNLKYVAILVVVVAVILAGSIFMMTGSSKSSSSDITQKNQEEVSDVPIEIPKLSTGVYREMPSSTSPKGVVDIALNVTVGDSKYYVIEETLPANWTVKDTGTGTIDSSGNIKWVVLDAKNTVLKYSVVAPSNLGKYIFSGKYAIGSTEELFVIGKTEITVK